MCLFNVNSERRLEGCPVFAFENCLFDVFDLGEHDHLGLSQHWGR